jgi:hypothetical protein
LRGALTSDRKGANDADVRHAHAMDRSGAKTAKETATRFERSIELAQQLSDKVIVTTTHPRLMSQPSRHNEAPRR